MAVGAQTGEWVGPSRRRVPRFRIQAPLDVKVSRAGVSDTVPGRSVNVCERGIAAMLAGELVPGETVEVEVQLSSGGVPFRTTATVRYLDRLRCGFEFTELSAEQRSTIRDWARTEKAETETATVSTPLMRTIKVRDVATGDARSSFGGGGGSGWTKKWRTIALIAVVVIAAFILGVFWWRWNRGWEELESGLKTQPTSEAGKTRVQVPTEVMQKLLVHRVDPIYPAEARKDNLQGIIALDIFVSQDGSVVGMRALNGPDVLSKAAMDALRWWKFSPYRVNGEPVEIETTVAVEFRR
jgi:TonB family protein